MGTEVVRARRPAWLDRFSTPAPADLLADLAPEQADLVSFLCDELRAIPGLRMGVSWEGLPWRWAIVFRARTEPHPPAAYVVPDPDGPLAGLPVPSSLVERVGARSLPRHVREVISTAPQVAGVIWATVRLASRAHAQDALTMVRTRLAEPAPA